MPLTPYIQVNKEKMLHNIERAHTYIFNKNPDIVIRPHIKTHKIPSIAKQQFAAGAQGITVAKIGEAQVMADAGIDDIFIAYPIVTKQKAEQLVALYHRTKRLIIAVDSLKGAKVLSDTAIDNDIQFEVRLEINTGLDRTGILAEEAIDFCQTIVETCPGLQLTGIFTFRGAMLDGKPTSDIVAAGIDEGTQMVELANTLREAGFNIIDVSVGSTQSAFSAAGVEGVTEVRIGTYVFHDMMQVAFGIATVGDCAAAVKVTVVSKPDDKRAVVDGGSKTFATDVQPVDAHIKITGFGHVVEYPEITFVRMNEEHGVLQLNGADVAIGEVLTIIPNHICSTVNLHDYLYMDDLKTTVEARGKLQ